jgi:hypothetical protein
MNDETTQTGTLTMFTEKAYKVPNVGPAYKWIVYGTQRGVTKAQARTLYLDIKDSMKPEPMRGEWIPDPKNH